jgi:hypothetical protein
MVKYGILFQNILGWILAPSRILLVAHAKASQGKGGIIRRAAVWSTGCYRAVPFHKNCNNCKVLLSIYLFIYYLFIYLFIYVFMYFFYLFINLFIYLFI